MAARVYWDSKKEWRVERRDEREPGFDESSPKVNPDQNPERIIFADDGISGTKVAPS